MKKVLNVGGNNRTISLPEQYAGWEHILLDIDPTSEPDIVCDARELTFLPAAEYDSVYCSHNLEHYHHHEVAKVLTGFAHVLKSDGFVFIRVPDIAAVMQIVVEKQLDIDDILYQSRSGAIKVRDVIYGHGKQIENSGSDFFAHKTGFTEKSLRQALYAASFKAVLTRRTRLEIQTFAFIVPPTDNALNALNIQYIKT